MQGEGRAEILHAEDSPESWVVLHESVLWQPILPPDDMAEQLAHLVEVLRKRRTLTQLVPRNSGAHPFMMGVSPPAAMAMADTASKWPATSPAPLSGASRATATNAAATASK
ncbi:Scr1 family TA system antitoxin-like transcriptional regulator [Streptomyces puniciscabiei]|uniref:Scr1 family TA system antitoxin-like transcriptional regulator n=1 Tax=Streptomyces puniciscabiei TaxID=164348 RepID=UPI003330CCF9